MCTNIGHVCLCFSSSCPDPQGGRVPGHTQGHGVSAGGRTSSPYCGLLTFTIHMCCDLFSPKQPRCKLPSAGSQAAPQPGPCTLAVYRCWGSSHSPTAPLLLRRHRLLGCQGNAHWLLYSCLWQLPFLAAPPFSGHHLWLQSDLSPFFGHCSLSAWSGIPSDWGLPRSPVTWSRRPCYKQSALLHSEITQLFIHTCFLGARPLLQPSPPQALPSYYLCDCPPHNFQVAGSFSLCQRIQVVWNLHLRCVSSATGSTWGSSTAWFWVSSSISTSCLTRLWEPITANCQCSHKPDFYFFYLTIPTHINPLIVAWKKMRKKGGKMPAGVGMQQYQSEVMQTKLSGDPCEAGTHACSSSDLLSDLGHEIESPLAGLRWEWTVV